MKKLLFIALIISVTFGCRSKKTITEYKEIIKIDTLEIVKEREIVKRFTDTLTIQSPCDSLGNLKPFSQTILTSQGKITLSGVNNVITHKIDLNGYISETSKTKQVSIKDNKQINTKIVTKYRVPLWCYITIGLLISIIFLLLRFKK
jgi:hypothetical protein